MGIKRLAALAASLFLLACSGGPASISSPRDGYVFKVLSGDAPPVAEVPTVVTLVIADDSTGQTAKPELDSLRIGVLSEGVTDQRNYQLKDLTLETAQSGEYLRAKLPLTLKYGGKYTFIAEFKAGGVLKHKRAFLMAFGPGDPEDD